MNYNLNKKSMTVQIRDINHEGKSYWNDEHSDRLKDLVTIEDSLIVSINYEMYTALFFFFF